MKIIEPSVKELIQADIFKHIELVGRTCYKSEDKITEDSAEKFVNMLKNRNHGAMLEHGTVYLIIPVKDVQEWVREETEETPEIYNYLHFVRQLPFSKENDKNNNYYITTNYRVIIENNLEYLMEKYQSECTEYHYKRRTFKITCNRGVSHEFVRHRVFSFAQESQRYVNYTKEKYGSEIKVIKPLYFEEGTDLYNIWKESCEKAETNYFKLIDLGAVPQQAREVLPNATATELVLTGFESQWEEFFKLRCAKDAHPQAQEIANKIKEIF